MPMRARRDLLSQTSLSVRLSITLCYCIKTNAHIVIFFPPSDKGKTGFLSASPVTKFQGELPQLGR